MKRLLRPAAIAGMGALLLSLLWPTPAHADGTVITVTTAEDDNHTACIPEHPCSLHAALSQANSTSGDVTIKFDIPGGVPHTIVLREQLPAIEKDNLRILGESDPDFVDRPVIVLDGGGLIESALRVYANQVTIRGLSLVEFTGRSAVLTIQGDHNTVRNCMVGISPSGVASGGEIGIQIWGEYNAIDSNLISGNRTGVLVSGPHTTLTSNYIGVDFSGTRAVPGMSTGISLETNANYTQIGGAGSRDGNIIAGAVPWGWGILVGSLFENVIVGNKIGTNAAGDAAIPNYVGIEIGSSTCTGGCRIPYNTRIEGNLLSGNLSCGIDLGRFTTFVYGNYIGTDASGTHALPNGECGVKLSGDEVLLGGTSPGEGNVISGNPVGVEVEGEGNRLLGNRIGTSADGTAAVPNQIGIRVTSPNNEIGGDEDGHGNLISGNEVGLLIAADHIIARNNRIGTDVTGYRPLPNGVGVRLDGYGEGDYIGGGDEAMRNIVAWNSSHGIELVMAGGVHLTGNLIHDNGGDGIRLSSGDVGASGSGSRNTFTINSTYSNGGLGIKFGNRALNRGIIPPDITASERTYVAGTACPNCRVEVFQSDSDPSGFGEGKTYLAWDLANADGRFDISYPDVGACKVLTATATDADGNTSEFSRNAGAGICFRPPVLMATIWILLAGGGGSAFTTIIRRRPPSLRSLPWIIVGGLVGMGLGLLLLRLPFVQVDWGQPEAQSAPAPQGGNLPAPITVTPILGITVTPVTPGPGPEIMARQNANCRQGPSVQFDVATHLTQGQVVPITGRLTQGGWWQVQPSDLLIPCWIAENLVETYGDLSTVPVVVSPPTPTPTKEAVSPPQGCRCWTGNVCQSMPQCPAQCTPCPQ
jgi:hypothetical protein